MKKIFKNTIINILLISPLFILAYSLRNHQNFDIVMRAILYMILILIGGFLVVSGFIRIGSAILESYRNLLHMYKLRKQAHEIVKQDERLEICSKCNGKGYTFWINNINGRSS